MVKPDLGNVETKYYTFGQTPHEFVLESGEKLGPITLAYETYGALNNVQVQCDFNITCFDRGRTCRWFSRWRENRGWWDDMVGPGKAFDTEKYFVICSNILGGCKGSTGPSSLNPVTQHPYALDFPVIGIGIW